MICSRLNSRATQSAPKTAECRRFGECVHVVSPEQGHLATPTSPTPTVLYLVSQSQPLPSKDWWTGYIPLEGRHWLYSWDVEGLHDKIARLIEKWSVIGWGWVASVHVIGRTVIQHDVYSSCNTFYVAVHSIAYLATVAALDINNVKMYSCSH